MNDSFYVTWSAETAFEIGSIVQYENGIYRAKWWTKGDVPIQSGDGAWEYLGEAGGSEDVGEIQCNCTHEIIIENPANVTLDNIYEQNVIMIVALGLIFGSILFRHFRK